MHLLKRAREGIDGGVGRQVGVEEEWGDVQQKTEGIGVGSGGRGPREITNSDGS